MEQRLAALFASVGNALDSSTYTYSDSDYLVRKALVEFLDGENALVASARKIQDSSEVVDSVLNYIVSTDFSVEDPAEWYRKAMRIVVEFSDFAFRNEMSQDSARYAALLPEGHPRALNSITLTASAQRSALAEWMAADPRLDEEASAQLYKLYSVESDTDELAVEFEYLKAEAMVASGKMPEDLLPLTAAFNLSRAQRSKISSFFAQFRRRDRKGRFAEEFGRLSLIFGGKEGFFSAAPKIVGPGSGPDRAIVEFDGSDARIPKGLYDVDATKGENVKAYLPKSATEGLPQGREVVAEADKQYAIDLDELLANKVETPLNWEKAGKGFKSKDGKFVAEPIKNSDAEKAIDRARGRGDDLIIAGVGDGDAFDPEASGGSFLVADAKGKSLGVAQDWAGIQEIAVANGAGLGSQGESGDFVPFGADDVRFDRRMEQQGRLMQRPLGGRPGQAEPDLDQDTSGGIDKSKLSPSMIGEGYNFSKDGENSWSKEGSGADGESYTVARDSNGKWVVSETSGSGDSIETRDLESFDNALEAFEYANDQGATPSEFDEAWVNELMSEGGPDLDQDARTVPTKVMREMLSPEMAEKHKALLDEADQAIFNNDLRAIERLISRAAVDSNIPDEVYSALDTAREARTQRGYMAEEMIYGSSKEELEGLLDDPEFAGWRNRIEDAINQYVDLDQDAPTLSEKQMEAASGKQYAFLGEFLEERQLDPATEQAFKDAVENKNLNKAQASSLIALGRSADFKPGVDPNKPSERMLNSLQGYLSSKDLAPSEIKEVLDSLQKDGSRNNVDALLNKLRRKKDKPIDLNQGAGSLTRHSDGSYEWEDVYNNVNVNKTPNGWEVEYTSPDLQDDGASNWSNRIFNSEDEALAFAEELIKQNQDDNGYGRAADNLMSTADLDQEAKGTLADAATDKQWDFLQSLLDGKKIDNPELAAAVRSALADRNLTKGEVGAFIGQLRPLEDKPNVRREPSAKQIASIKRALLERDLTPEDRKELEDRLEAGLSFDEASEILNDLKKRPITLDGMTRLLDKLALDQDMDTMRYLLDKPEYAEYYDAIRDTMRQLAIDTDDPRFQDLIDARDSVDLDQNVDNVSPESLEAIKNAFDVDAIAFIDLMGREWEGGDFGDWTSPDGKVSLTLDADIDDDGRPSNSWGLSVDGKTVATGRLDYQEDTLAESILDQLGIEDPYFKLSPEELKQQRIKNAEMEREELLKAKKAELERFRGISSDETLDQIAKDHAERVNSKYDRLIEKIKSEDVDLDQDVSSPFGREMNTDWDIDQGLLSEEDQRKYEKEISEVGLTLNSGHAPTAYKLRDEISNDTSISDNVKNELLSAIDSWLEVDSEVNSLFEDFWSRDEPVSNSALDKIKSLRNVDSYRPWSPLLEDLPRNEAEYDAIVEDMGNELRAQNVDLDQNVSSRSALNAEVDKLAEELDALESFAVDGDELKDYVNEFYNSTRSPEFAAEMAASIYDMSRYVDNPDLKQRLRDLSARLDEELADRFGVAQAARVDGRDFLDLDEASAGIDSEREMFFETDVDRIAEILDDRDSYGDNRSGGAEARISENEDGTFTARVDYDRDSEEQTFEDRDEAVTWAANQVSDYNSDVRPSSYGDSIDLDREAERARTDDQAAAFADRLDEIANDLDENRGDPRLANSLRAYGERIREMIANRDRQRQSQVEEEPTTPETMDEMATDPELNPAGYAEYIAIDLANKLDADSAGAGDPFDRRMQYDVPSEGTYVSNDGRVEVSINYDADTDGEGGMRNTSYFIVDIDGEKVASGSLFDVDGVVDGIFAAVKDHFSKKA